MQFRHKVEVHTIQTTYQGRWQEDDIDDREDLNDAVLFDINQTEERILQVVQTVKTKSRIVEERVDILNHHRQTWLQVFRHKITLKQVADNSLFIHDVLTDDGYFFLQVLNLDKYILIYMVFCVDFTTQFGNHIRCILNQVGILLYSSLHQSYQYMKSAWEIAGINEHALDCLVETT